MSPELSITEQENRAAEVNTMEYMEQLAALNIVSVAPTNRLGTFPIKPVGDPFAGFAKGLRDK